MDGLKVILDKANTLILANISYAHNISSQIVANHRHMRVLLMRSLLTYTYVHTYANDGGATPK